MTLRNPSETLTERLRRSRKTLEMQIEEGNASCDSREAFERLSDFEKQQDLADDSLVQRGDA